MKCIKAPDPIAIIEATEAEIVVWQRETAVGGILLPAKEAYAHWWISPTGLCFLIVPPQLGELKEKLEAPA